ncbi:DUF3391 domain-containing protein [Accumulibacter sp.]|uniref:DUF3391 domain-containing protein n=1 Tax=Accumulibacter sp. TaxID=2053492 RepID=UPI00260AE17A|nr:DUF3391 domain-containing protein [Accumulibacter sp.]
MLKRISVEQLRVGMYLKEFCGSWMEHPFWRSSFVIADPKDIDSIRSSSVREVWIDSARGLDLAPGESVVSVAESEAKVAAELARAAELVRQIERVPPSFPERRKSLPVRGRRSARCSPKRASAMPSMRAGPNGWSRKSPIR